MGFESGLSFVLARLCVVPHSPMTADPHAYYIVHVRDTENGEITLGTWPFGTKLREFLLGPHETILVRDETATDVLVIAQSARGKS